MLGLWLCSAFVDLIMELQDESHIKNECEFHDRRVDIRIESREIDHLYGHSMVDMSYFYISRQHYDRLHGLVKENVDPSKVSD